MSGATEPLRGGAPWRPSHAQTSLMSALLSEPAQRRRRLGAWSRDLTNTPPHADVVALLPFAAAGLVDVAPDSEVTRLAQQAYAENASVNMIRMARLLPVLDAFEEAGISVALLKGAAMALRYYRSYGTRPMVDVDVLVRPGDVESAQRRLEALGWICDGTGSDSLRSLMRVQHAITFTGGRGDSLDLHWRPLWTPTGSVETELWTHLESLVASGTTVRVLAPTYQLFQLCVHAVQPSWSPSPRWMLDVAAILDADGQTRVDWHELVALAARTSTSARLRTAVLDFEEVAGPRFPDSVRNALAAVREPSWEKRELESFTRLPPYGNRDVLAWHWYQFRRLRPADPVWRGWPVLAGFAGYTLLKQRLRRTTRGG